MKIKFKISRKFISEICNLNLCIFLVVVVFVMGIPEANSFQKYTIRCDLLSIGSSYQSKIIDVIKTCFKRNRNESIYDYKVSRKTSFYNMNWLEETNLSDVFYGINKELTELIIILNGLDEEYINTSIGGNGELYVEHRGNLNKNIRKLEVLLHKYGISPLSKRCMKLKSNDGCYAQVRDRLGLPSVANIRTRVHFRLKR